MRVEVLPNGAFNNPCNMIIPSAAAGNMMDTIIDENATTEELSENRSLVHRKSSLISSPEDDPPDIHKSHDKLGYILPPPKTNLKVLLAFNQLDQAGEALSRAAEKLGFETTFCSSYDSSLEEYQSKHHDLVLIDTRSNKGIDFELLCRSIKNTKGSLHTVIVAVVKKSTFDRDDGTIFSLLEAGFSRCIAESSHITNWINEMVQLKHCDVKQMAQMATTYTLYTALDKTSSFVVITDDSYKCQYINNTLEKHMNHKNEEIVGKNILEYLINDPAQLNSIGSYLSKGREWTGPLNLRKKTNENFSVLCKASSVSCSGRSPTHFVLVMDVEHSHQPRGSIGSIRRGSNDIRSLNSDYLRRASLAKLNALPLEAPITKIIGLIEQAREGANNTQVVQYLDKVEDLLRTSELYASQVREDARIKADEPVVSDLITALLSKQPNPIPAVSSRRSSNDSAIFRPSRTGVYKVSANLRELLDSSLSWDFEIFRLEEMTKKRPLRHLGMHLFMHFDVANTLHVDEATLDNWLTIIEAHYHPENFYHNSTHAADVMQASAGFLEKERIKSIMEPLDEAMCLIAAAAHDVDHPGKSSAFLSNSDNPLAILYNDITILESHHAAFTFKLTLSDDRVNIFKNLDRDTYKIVRHNIVDMILATEMTRHFEHLAKFVNVFCAKVPGADTGEIESDFIGLTLPENITLIKRMLIKCSDVSNPTRPLRLYVEWARRIAEEYFQQTDEEKTRGLPVVMPMFDRASCSVPKSQIGFVDYIINDMFEAWNAFVDMPELITYMRQNYIKWKEFDEQGHTTLADLRILQNTVLMAPVFHPKSNKKD